MPALFITGTDTGVGKTVVTALLTRALRAQGADCVAMKPLASGCEWQDGVLQSEDATFLREVGGFEELLDLVCPVRLELPLAPLVAARQSGIETQSWAQTTRQAFDELSRHHEWVLVEGVGGWNVPLWHRADGSMATCTDLVTDWDLPVIVVARRILGTINHTSLTCRAVQEVADLRGVIFCDAEHVEENDIAAQTSPQLACELAQTSQLAFVPHTRDWNEVVRSLEVLASEMVRAM